VDCVKSTAIIEDIIKKSRFIGLAIPCQTVENALQCIEQLHQQHPHANHIVFAYRIKSATGILSRFHDDGEPAGSAGKPIYQHLDGKDLINLLVIVVRYFGGIKLGVGGLTRAYSNTTKKVLESSSITKYIEYVEVGLKMEYPQIQSFQYQLKKLDGKIIQQEFAKNVHFLVKIPQKNLSILSEAFECNV